MVIKWVNPPDINEIDMEMAQRSYILDVSNRIMPQKPREGAMFAVAYQIWHWYYECNTERVH